MRETLNNGRIISHTLVFAALLWVIALLALRKGMYGPMAVSFGSFAPPGAGPDVAKAGNTFLAFFGVGISLLQ
ncbi:MAG: hypothetical protein VR68_12100 [Peptococcaceae bacterium BRH_c4a]|nr:MAG: hypothetical protein VR68_12100 [Peptococcaceae bacterium BRH_c4a]